MIEYTNIKGLPGYQVAFERMESGVNIAYLTPLSGKAKGRKVYGCKRPSGLRMFSLRCGHRRIFLTEGRIACCILHNIGIYQISKVKLQLSHTGAPLDQIESKRLRDQKVMFTSYDDILDIVQLIGKVRDGNILELYSRAEGLKCRVVQSLIRCGIPVSVSRLVYEEAIEIVCNEMSNLNKRAIQPLYIWIRNAVLKRAKIHGSIYKELNLHKL